MPGADRRQPRVRVHRLGDDAAEQLHEPAAVPDTGRSSRTARRSGRCCGPTASPTGRSTTRPSGRLRLHLPAVPSGPDPDGRRRHPAPTSSPASRSSDEQGRATLPASASSSRLDRAGGPRPTIPATTCARRAAAQRHLRRAARGAGLGRRRCSSSPSTSTAGSTTTCRRPMPRTRGRTTSTTGSATT